MTPVNGNFGAWWGVIPPYGNPYYWGDYFPPPPPTVHREVCPCCGAILSVPMTYTSDSTSGVTA